MGEGREGGVGLAMVVVVQLVVGGYVAGFGMVSRIVGAMYRCLAATSVCLVTGFKDE